uniref:Uncharacterized protein n=1 Tax=Anopheles arabiensis TaxID=7173 RepID=A0A182IGU5_ANOAR
MRSSWLDVVGSSKKNTPSGKCLR